MRKKWIFITGICVGFVLITAVLSVMIFQLRHKHDLGETKEYHIYNDRIYYTRQCIKDSHTQRFETDATFAEVLGNLGSGDRVVIEEHITTSEIFKIKSTASQPENLQNDVVINIDLNNKEIYSMFELDASYGTIKFNISNGRIKSNYKNAIKASGENGEIEISIKNVECSSNGAKNTPLYIEDVNKVTVNAWDSKFISQNNSLQPGDYGVGVFINNSGDFQFENCVLEGGDGIHVRQGNISLKGCDLINTGLTVQDYQSVDKGFSAVGASLTAHCYTWGAKISNFEITVEDCVMITNNSNRVMYIYKVAKDGYEARVNPNSYVKIKSCKFDENPEQFYNLDKVIYEGDNQVINNGQGYWVYGDVDK